MSSPLACSPVYSGNGWYVHSDSSGDLYSLLSSHLDCSPGSVFRRWTVVTHWMMILILFLNSELWFRLKPYASYFLQRVIVIQWYGDCEVLLIQAMADDGDSLGGHGSVDLVFECSSCAPLRHGCAFGSQSLPSDILGQPWTFCAASFGRTSLLYGLSTPLTHNCDCEVHLYTKIFVNRGVFKAGEN